MDRILKKKLKHIEMLQEEASNMAVKIVIDEARKILNDDDGLFEFIMAMGACFFTIKEGGKYDVMHLSDDDYEVWCESDDYLNIHGNIIDEQSTDFQKEFFDMVDDLNTDFNVCGYPVRFTAKSEEVHDWGDTIKDPVIYINKS